MNVPPGFLQKPAVKAFLATLPPPVDPNGPRTCCAEFAIVTDCDGETDSLYCGICDRRWTRSCSVADLVTN